MTEPLDQWIQQVNGQQVGAGQCWDLANSYLTNVLGGNELSTQGGTHPGYAIGSFTGYSSNGMDQYFTKQNASSSAPPGSLAFWDWGTNFPNFQAPLSHVAIVLQDQGDSLKVLSQNSPQGYAAIQTLPKEGLAGYLVPNGVPMSSGTDTSNVAELSSNTADSTVSPSASWQNWFQSPIPGWAANGFQGLFGPQGLFPNGQGWNAAGLATADLGLLDQILLKMFMPSTWIRLGAFIGAILLIGLGILFIILDFRKHSKNED